MHALNDRHGRLDESGEWRDSADPRPPLLPSMLYSLATKELVQNGELSLILAAAEPGSPYPAVLQQHLLQRHTLFSNRTSSPPPSPAEE